MCTFIDMVLAASDQCALNTDGSLKDASEIHWYADATDDQPMTEPVERVLRHIASSLPIALLLTHLAYSLLTLLFLTHGLLCIYTRCATLCNASRLSLTTATH